MADRYRLSFTTGGLFVQEAASVATSYLATRDWAMARTQARQENLLQVRTAASVTRISKEVTARLEHLDDQELQALIDLNLHDRASLLWVAACRRYTFIPGAYNRRVVQDDEEARHTGRPEAASGAEAVPSPAAPVAPQQASPLPRTALKEQHLVFQENQRGVTFDKLFGPYLAGAKRIVVTDPYLRMFHQQRNLMELMETINRHCQPEDEVAVHVVTVADDFNGDRQTENFQKITEACTGVGIRFTWDYDTTGTKHDRDITTDQGWKIVLSRGLDVYQRFEPNEAFSFANRMQQHRQCKEFNVTFVRIA